MWGDAPTGQRHLHPDQVCIPMCFLSCWALILVLRRGVVGDRALQLGYHGVHDSDLSRPTYTVSCEKDTMFEDTGGAAPSRRCHYFFSKANWQAGPRSEVESHLATILLPRTVVRLYHRHLD